MMLELFTVIIKQFAHQLGYPYCIIKGLPVKVDLLYFIPSCCEQPVKASMPAQTWGMLSVRKQLTNY